MIMDLHPSLELVIGSFSDNSGDMTAAKKLTEQGAKVVMTKLVAQGLAFVRIKAKGFGVEMPVADNGTELGRALNNRMCIRVAKK